MRLDKFISQTTLHSRKDCLRLVRSARITINGHRAKSASQVIAPSDVITLDDQPVYAFTNGYWMLHKPAGSVCANRDSEHPTVLDVVSEAAFAKQTAPPDNPTDTLAPLRNAPIPDRQLDDIQIAGRLDLDTTGLVLLTTDGQWNHKVTAPSKQCRKRYRVTLESALTDDAIHQLTQGIVLRGEKHVTQPATLNPINSHICLLSIVEGKYHQVKRMFAAVDNHVIALHREAIGTVELDAKLAVGDYRALSGKEIESFM